MTTHNKNIQCQPPLVGPLQVLNCYIFQIMATFQNVCQGIFSEVSNNL